jgi:hypothetical protein
MNWVRGWMPDLLAAALLIAAIAALDRQVFHLWWNHDDFFNLHYVSDHHPLRYCLDPRVWRLLPMRMLTPLLFLSLHLDLHLFGPEPQPFYAHQLAAAALAFVAFYAALRLWLAPPPAALGAGVALAGAPTLQLVQLLMVRHYVEGFLLASLAVVFFVRAARRRSALELWLSVLLYFGACLAKEVFVPLAVLLPLLPVRASQEDVPSRPEPAAAGARRRLPEWWRDSWAPAVPHLGALLLYLAWRLRMLGTLVGGNGWSVRAADLPGLAAALPLKLARAMAGPGPFPAAGVLLLAALAAGAAAACWRRPRASWLLLAAAAAALAPVLPASTEMEARYAFPLWTVLAAALACGCARLAGAGRAGRAAAVLLGAVAAVSVLGVHRQAWAESYAAIERASVENRALLRLPPGAWLRHPAGPPASLHELAWLRQAYPNRPPGALRTAPPPAGSVPPGGPAPPGAPHAPVPPAGPGPPATPGPPAGGWFFDDLFLCSLPPAARLLEYDPASHRVIEVSARLPRLRASYCSSIRPGAPLSADLLLDGGDLRWRLGPYRTGSYSLVVGGGVDAYSVPPAAGFQVPNLKAVTLRVHYASLAGWNTYSPELPLAAGPTAHVSYARGL